MLNIDDTTRDLTVAAGAFEEVDGLTAVGQRIRARIFTFVDEWFLDTEFGVPYLDQILGQNNPNLVTIAGILKREIRKSLNDEAVLTSLNLEYDSSTRNLEVSMLITAPDGVESPDNFIL